MWHWINRMMGISDTGLRMIVVASGGASVGTRDQGIDTTMPSEQTGLDERTKPSKDRSENAQDKNRQDDADNAHSADDKNR